jgi:hypothetical protein
MSSAEYLAQDLRMQSRGIHVICWDDKADLVHALLVLQSAFTRFPETPTLLPTQQSDLQRFGLGLFENADKPTDSSMRILLIPQASTEATGAWLNGWRRRLSDPPGTLIVIRHTDLMALYRRAPDLMSFAQSEIHEASSLLPLVTRETLDRMREVFPDGWNEPLNSLPGSMPPKADILKWMKTLRSNLD